MAERNGATKMIATRYRRAYRASKGRILDELCATTGWRRNHARKALKAALRPTIVTTSQWRPLKHRPKSVVALIFCWAVLCIAGALGKAGAA